jgi:hypothetical protein
LLLAETLLEQLPRDSYKKSAQLSARGIEVSGMMNQPHKDILGNLRRFDFIGGHEQGEAEDRSPVRAIDLRKRITVARAEPLQEIPVS